MNTATPLIRSGSRRKQLKRSMLEYRNLVHESIVTLRTIGLSTEAQGRVLGFETTWKCDLEKIEQHLLLVRSYDVEKRIELLFKILARADGLFAPLRHTTTGLSWWWKRRIKELGNRTPLTVLSSGELVNLELLDAYLARMTG